MSNQTITRAELISIIEMRSRSGCFAVTIDAKTMPKMRKTNNPYFGKVFKVSRVNGMLNWIYQNAVNRQRTREGNEADFEVKPRHWGTRTPHTPFVTHVKDDVQKLYLELKVERSLEHSYVDDAGNLFDKAKIAEFLPATKDEGQAQGLDKAVILRDYDIENVTAIAVDGITYQIGEKKELAIAI